MGQAHFSFSTYNIFLVMPDRIVVLDDRFTHICRYDPEGVEDISRGSSGARPPERSPGGLYRP